MHRHVRRRGLVAAGAGLALAMAVIVPIVSRHADPLTGYVTVLAIYWLCFCVPTALLFGNGSQHVGLRRSQKPYWVMVAAFMLPAIIFVAAGPHHWIGADGGLMMLAVGCALINGPLEELAWRRPYRAQSHGALSYELLGLGLFTAWHIPLYFSHGMVFDHGAFGLVGGALLLGAVWTIMTRASQSIGWPMLSHALVNIAAFGPLFTMNVSG